MAALTYWIKRNSSCMPVVLYTLFDLHKNSPNHLIKIINNVIAHATDMCVVFHLKVYTIISGNYHMHGIFGSKFGELVSILVLRTG